MLVSYRWLQTYFEKKLPAPEKLAEILTFSFAEIEGCEKKGGDTIFDTKVLPDRACYALSHRGIAYEIAAITGLPKKEMQWPQPEITKVRPLNIRVEAPDLCPRYMARRIENITQKELSWVKEHLEALGQRSINPVVDGANLVMFDMGQPLHAFDADKVEGGIVVRLARKGEKFTTLDNHEIILDESILVIADHASPLALAGIKGGEKAEVTSATKNLILEAASFNASYIRKASERLGIKTDASKRYENRIAPSQCEVGMRDFTAYLFEMDKNLSAGDVVDIYSDVPQNIGIATTAERVSKKLGVPVSEHEAIGILKRLQFGVERKGKELLLTPPLFRADLLIPEDVAEEVGRIIGYDKVPVKLPPKSDGPVEIPKSFYYEWKVREALVSAGFSEVMTSSFSEKGDIAIEKPLAADKAYARPNLRGNFQKALQANLLNAPLLGTDVVKMFEIGWVFPLSKGGTRVGEGGGFSGEHTSLALGVVGPKKKAAGVLETGLKAVTDALGREPKGEAREGVFETNLDETFSSLPEPKRWDISLSKVRSQTFKPFSSFPFIVRDIAIFVSSDTTPESVAKVIKEHAGTLVVRGPELFDEFSKGGRKSLAFRLVFQSFERTLSDEEVNKAMEKVYATLTEKGWEVR